CLTTILPNGSVKLRNGAAKAEWAAHPTRILPLPRPGGKKYSARICHELNQGEAGHAGRSDPYPT
ncbi:MAG TPA: hypothetical protein VGB98_24560, partial [Pyrinomonadaceae bacterium]